MAQHTCFVRSAEEFDTFALSLKLLPCPHCHVVGALIRHGSLRGFDDCHRRTTLRARRIFCSNRHARQGCGHTFSVWIADKIRRLGLTTTTLWRFLQHAVAHGILDAIRHSVCPLCHRTWLRIWKRFKLAQSNIRTTLFDRCPLPQLPDAHRPAAQVLAHLQAAFPDSRCPIAAFQHTCRTFFV